MAMSLSVASSPSKNMWAWWGWKMRAGRKRMLVSPQPPVWKPKERLATIISLTLVSKVTGPGCKCTKLGKQWSSCKTISGPTGVFQNHSCATTANTKMRKADGIPLPMCEYGIQLPMCVLNNALQAQVMALIGPYAELIILQLHTK